MEKGTYIQFAADGKIVVQDPNNGRHMFITPPANRREGMKFNDFEELFDYILQQFDYNRGWINNK
jgi:hypothetical protein